MKLSELPFPMRVTGMTTSPDGRSVDVAFEVDPEYLRTAIFTQRLQYEVTLAECYLGVLLDDLCRSYGWDPSLIWRSPREAETGDRRISITGGIR